MLDYGVLSMKPQIKLQGKTEESIDLLVKTVEMPNDIINEWDVCVVNRYYVARPDLISLAFYNNDKYGDIICKVNGISNPFELNEGMVLDIPSLSAIHEMFKNRETASSEQATKDSFINKKTSNLQKTISDVRSPAQSVVGDHNYILRKDLGLILY